MRFLRSTILLGLAMLPLAHGATTLTGIQVISMDASGNHDATADQAFNTHSTSGRFKLWIINGENQDGDFINGPDLPSAPINIPMTSGTHTFTLYADCGNTPLKPYYGISLYFNLDSSPAISAFAPLNTSSTQFFPDWSPSRGKVMRLIDSVYVQSDGKTEFVDGKTKVTITAFNFSGPNVFKKDRVDRYNTWASGGRDFVGQVVIQVSAPPEISNGGVVNAASFTGKVAPGSLFSIFGSDLATGEYKATTLPLPLDLFGTSVTIGGKPAPLVFASKGQLNAQVPYDLQEGPAPVVVTVNGSASTPRTVQVVKAAPGIFQFGEKRAVVQNADGSINTADNGAEVGSYVVTYLTGGGAPDNAVQTGVAAKADPLSRHRATVAATIGGIGAEVLWQGLTPGFVGLTQANLRVPGLAPGNHPVVVTMDSVQSNTAVVTVK